MRIKSKIDRPGLPLWPLWSSRISSHYIFALASMSIRDLFFFANGQQVLLAIYKRSRNILDSRVYLGYRISEVRGENKGIL